MEHDGTERGAPPRDGLRAARTRDLLRALVDTGERVVADNLALMRSELTTDARRAAVGVSVLAAGGVLATCGLLVLCLTAVYLLALVMPAWVSGIVVGGGLATVGGLLTRGGIQELKKSSSSGGAVKRELTQEVEWARRRIHDDA